MRKRIFTTAFLFLLCSCGSQDGADTPFAKEPESNPNTQTDPGEKNKPSTDVCKYDSASNLWISIEPMIIENRAVGERYFAKGGGCVEKPLFETWAVSHNQSGVKWKDGDIDALRKVEDPNTSLFFEADYSAGPAIFKQRWVMGFMNLFKGNPEEAKSLEIQYQKIRGTKHIVYWKGKILLQALSDTVTSVLIENEIEGTQVDMKKAEGGIADLLNNFKTQPPEWKYLKPTIN